MRLYYHKTDGGAEYLTDTYIVCPNGHKEGVSGNANIVVRIDGDIDHDAEIRLRGAYAKAPELLECLRKLSGGIVVHMDGEISVRSRSLTEQVIDETRALIAEIEGGSDA
jgi:hypothetical protein